MLFDLVRDSAARAHAQPAIIEADAPVTYGDLLTRSESIAAGLAQAGIDRFGCAVHSPADVVATVVAASAVGAEACVYPRDLDARGLTGFAARFEHEVVLTDEPQPLEGTRALPARELREHGAALAAHSGNAPVLILTTGTTGEPKGARHDWDRLVGAVRHRDAEPANRWLLTYNLNQFAGVQLLVHALASQATLVVPRARRPTEVLDAIRRHAVTHVSGTPTFWRLLIGRLRATDEHDLPLRQITLGGEAAPQGLIEQLQERFPQARISHVYAGTEFGSVVSVRDGRSGLPLSVLERGEDADVQLRVVDGELYIRSRVGMHGYHDHGDDEGEWRATGDLVEVGPDRIHFVGRRTEIINVGGAKIHPLPVEELVCAVEGVELAAVYGRPNPVTGHIVAVDVVAGPGVDPADLTQRIHERCRELPAAGRPRRIRIVPELQTRGEKVLRQTDPAGV